MPSYTEKLVDAGTQAMRAEHFGKMHDNTFQYYDVDPLVIASLSTMVEMTDGYNSRIDDDFPRKDLARHHLDALAYINRNQPPFYLVGNIGHIAAFRQGSRDHSGIVLPFSGGIGFYPDRTSEDRSLFIFTEQQLRTVVTVNGINHYKLVQFASFGQGSTPMYSVGYYGFVRRAADGRVLAGMNVFA